MDMVSRCSSEISSEPAMGGAMMVYRSASGTGNAAGESGEEKSGGRREPKHWQCRGGVRGGKIRGKTRAQALAVPRGSPGRKNPGENVSPTVVQEPDCGLGKKTIFYHRGQLLLSKQSEEWGRDRSGRTCVE